MKKVVLLLVAIATLGFAQAQIEAKINPLGAMFGNPDISGEYIINDNFGVELAIGTSFGQGYFGFVKVDNSKQSGFGIRAVAKYYFSPDDGGDGWYAGLYLRSDSKEYKIKDSSLSIFPPYEKREMFAIGLEFGKKWVFDSGFLIEAGLALGRPISESITYSSSGTEEEVGLDGYFKFAIGYRFN